MSCQEFLHWNHRSYNLQLQFLVQSAPQIIYVQANTASPGFPLVWIPVCQSWSGHNMSYSYACCHMSHIMQSVRLYMQSNDIPISLSCTLCLGQINMLMYCIVLYDSVSITSDGTDTLLFLTIHLCYMFKSSVKHHKCIKSYLRYSMLAM